MIKNYIKIALRSILRSKTYSVINILGLSAGLASFLVILLYLNYELSYDKWHRDLAKVYRVSLKQQADISNQTPVPLGRLIVQNYPNAEAATAIMANGDFEILISAGEKAIYQKDVVTADSSFLKVFPYKLKVGDAATALNAPNAAILSEDVARKLFGSTDPIGKQIKVHNAIDCIVTGIMQDPITPSHLPVKMLMRNPFEKQNYHWQNYSYQTYLKVKHIEAEEKLEYSINKLYRERLETDNQSFESYRSTDLFVDAIPNIHNFPKYGSSQLTTISVLLVLAGLLLLAGAINFSNLAIAKALSRAKEVGVRKVLGSSRKQLIAQFMTETTLQCLISLVLASLIVSLVLPYVNQLFNIHLSFWIPGTYRSFIIQMILCMLVVISLSGLYPSLFLSHYSAAKVLSGEYSRGKKGVLFRNSLILVQFMVSVFFIIGILVVRSQMNYMQNRDKGFSGERVMRIEARQDTRENGFTNVKDALMAIQGVSSVSKTTRVPGDRLFADTSTICFKYEGKEVRMASVKISKEYFKTLKIVLLNGRELTDSYTDQHTRAAVINESASQKLGLQRAIGKTITFPYCDSIPVQIVGIVKDFNVHGFERQIQPEVYTIGNDACMYQSAGAILVKLDSKHIKQSVSAIEKAWKNVEPAFPIRYSFLDDNFQQLFVSYIRLQKIITFFTMVAILISAMGLFALTTFYTKQRTKEIGIRKVLGSSVTQLAMLLSKEFIYLVVLAVVAIMPVAWWFVQKWLQTFVYRTALSWWLFAAAGLAVIIIALLTVGIQSVKAASANPAKSLHDE